jgi:thiol-disulfide isomerase/thioredoxin
MKRLRTRAIWATAVVLALPIVVILSIFAIRSSGQGVAAPPIAGSVINFEVLDAAQGVPDTVFGNAKGGQLTLADFRGRVVLLNLWATWCGPCVREMPSLDRLQAALGSDHFKVVALSQDRGWLEVVKRFYAKHGLENLGIYLDQKGELSQQLGARGLPTSVLIDRQGQAVGRLEGPAEWDSPEALALMRHYLGDGSG